MLAIIATRMRSAIASTSRQTCGGGWQQATARAGSVGRAPEPPAEIEGVHAGTGGARVDLDGPGRVEKGADLQLGGEEPGQGAPSECVEGGDRGERPAQSLRMQDRRKRALRTGG